MDPSRRVFRYKIVVSLMHSQSAASFAVISFSLKGLNLTKTRIFSSRAPATCIFSIFISSSAPTAPILFFSTQTSLHFDQEKPITYKSSNTNNQTQLVKQSQSILLSQNARKLKMWLTARLLQLQNLYHPQPFTTKITETLIMDTILLSKQP